MPDYMPMMSSAERPEILKLYIETTRAPAAAEVARLIAATNRAFVEYARRRGDINQPVALAVTHLEIGSVAAQFSPMVQLASDSIDVVKAFTELYATRHIIAGFVTHLDGINKMIQAGVDEVRHWKGARALAKASARMVKANRAKSISYSATGINLGVTIANDNASALLAGERHVAESEKTGRPLQIDAELRDGMNIGDQSGGQRVRSSWDTYLRDGQGRPVLDEEGNPRTADEGLFNAPFGAGSFGTGKYGGGGSLGGPVGGGPIGGGPIGGGPVVFGTVDIPVSGLPAGSRSVSSARPAGEIHPSTLEIARRDGPLPNLDRSSTEHAGQAIDKQGWMLWKLDGREIDMLPITAGLELFPSDWKEAEVRGHLLTIGGRAVAFQVTYVSAADV